MVIDPTQSIYPAAGLTPRSHPLASIAAFSLPRFRLTSGVDPLEYEMPREGPGPRAEGFIR
jgi:hypothetical protein